MNFKFVVFLICSIFISSIICQETNVSSLTTDESTNQETTSTIDSSTTETSTTLAPSTTSSTLPTTESTTITTQSTTAETTEKTTEETTEPTTTSTEPTASSTEPTTTSTEPTTTSTEPTTTSSIPTTTSKAPFTTTEPPKTKVLSFRVPKNESIPACLLLNISTTFDIKYFAEKDNKESTETVSVSLENSQIVDYDGTCDQASNSLSVEFRKNWILFFNYTISDKKVYELNTVKLTYVVDNIVFPNASNKSIGVHTVGKDNLALFSANKGSSYKCFAKSDIKFDNVTMEITNYQAQPFIDGKSAFDTAVECSADTNTNKLVPIIVGSSLAVLVILVLIAYIIGRRKHRPGYQQV